MNDFKLKLSTKIQRTPSIVSFRFTPDRPCEFLPGQFAKLVLDEARPQNNDLNKYLSFSCSPTKDYIEFTKRISNSEFSRKLNALKPQDEILMQGPLGKCILHEEYKKIGFLVGGIGITPVISMVEYMADKDLDTDAVLLYSNRDMEEIAFKPELDSWKNALGNFNVVYTLTDCDVEQKECLAGRIDEKKIAENVSDITERIFFMFGPPRMVEAMKGLCLGAGCEEKMLKLENFIGY